MSAPKFEPETTKNGPKPADHTAKPQTYYDRIKQKFAAERDLRLNYRPEGTAQYTSDLTGELARYEIDPYAGAAVARSPIDGAVDRRRIFGAAHCRAPARAWRHGHS